MCVWGTKNNVDSQYRFYDIIKYWLKLLLASENKNTKKVYTLLKSHLDVHPNVKKWCALLGDLLC